MADELCIGCGARLQSESPKEPGYVPVSALGRAQPICRRCFRITHYGEFSRNVVPTDEYERQVGRIKEVPGTVLYVLDVFDLSGSLVQGLAEYVADSKVVLVVNKVDLLPVDIDYRQLTDWITKTVVQTGVKPVDIVFTSAQSDIGMPMVMSAIEQLAGNIVYVVGMANVGKSSVLNRLLQHLGDGTKPVFTVSKVPGTTLGMTGLDVSLPAGERVRIIDTPGLIHGTRLSDVLCADCLHEVVPSSRLRPRVYQLDPGQTLFLGNAARIDFRDGVHQSIVCYVSNDLVVHRTKLNRADEFQDSHRDDILKVPCPECRRNLGLMKARRIVASTEFRLKNPEGIFIRPIGADIALPGLGWIALSGKPLEMTLWLPQTLRPVIRPRLIGQLNRVQEHR